MPRAICSLPRINANAANGVGRRLRHLAYFGLGDFAAANNFPTFECKLVRDRLLSVLIGMPCPIARTVDRSENRHWFIADNSDLMAGLQIDGDPDQTGIVHRNCDGFHTTEQHLSCSLTSDSRLRS